jgi:hypothetical protein
MLIATFLEEYYSAQTISQHPNKYLVGGFGVYNRFQWRFDIELEQ